MVGRVRGPVAPQLTRTIKVGYEHRLVPLAEVTEAVVGAKTTVQGCASTETRPQLVATSLGCHIRGYATPVPSTNFVPNLRDGFLARVARKFRDPERKLERFARQYVRRFLRKNLTPFPAGKEFSFEKYISQTHYNEARRNELRTQYLRFLGQKLRRKHYGCKWFGKRESYPCYKYMRGIYSRRDAFKARLGPYIHAVERVVFFPHHLNRGSIWRYFVKGIEVRDRPRVIRERVYAPGALYWGTDHSKFESLITAKTMRMFEWQLMSYMFSDPTYSEIRHMIHQALFGTQICDNKYLCVECPPRRMSGDLWTSLSNGFTNLMVAKVLAAYNHSKIVGVFEGDDGLFRVVGDWKPNPNDYAQLGFDTKIEVSDDISETGFCQLFFDPVELSNIKDPLKVIEKTGWTMSFDGVRAGLNIRRQLLKAKALSLVFELPGCPIVQSFALALCRNVKARPRFEKTYYYQGDVPLVPEPKVVGPRTRVLFERLYGVSIAEQLRLESFFDSWELAPIELGQISGLLHLAHPDGFDYYSRFVEVAQDKLLSKHYS